MALENHVTAAARGATPYVQISGYGLGMNGYKNSYCEGMASGIHSALANAGVYEEDIDYINAHGPSDVMMDRLETEAIKQVFGRKAYALPISSIKGVTGNPLAAAGPLQIAAGALAIQNSLIPPTANYTHPDPDCDLDYVPGGMRRMSLQHALINMRGMGHTFNSMIISKASDHVGS